MNIGIVGSKKFTNYHLFHSIVNKIIKRGRLSDLNFYTLKELTFVKETGETLGLSSIVINYCEMNHFPLSVLDAKWDDLTAPGALVREKNGRQYNAKALFQRNENFINFIDILIIIHQEDYENYEDLVKKAKAKKIHIFDFNFSKMTPLSN